MRCLWKCLGTESCQEAAPISVAGLPGQVCEPVCAPPKCQVSCRPVNPGKCVQKCEAPHCAVICTSVSFLRKADDHRDFDRGPEKHCEGENCESCKTAGELRRLEHAMPKVCGEPVCRVDCQQAPSHAVLAAVLAGLPNELCRSCLRLEAPWSRLLDALRVERPCFSLALHERMASLATFGCAALNLGVRQARNAHSPSASCIVECQRTTSQ